MNDPAGRYVQLLCHDMNNPLTILYGQAALLNAALAGPERDDDRLRGIVAQVEEQTGRVITLVAEMRDAFRQVDGEDVQATSLEPVIREAAAFVTRLWRYRAGSLDLEMPPEDAIAHVRPLALRGGLWRLLAAAVDRSPRVRVKLEPNDAGFRLVIAETGGLPARVTPPDHCVKLALERSGWRLEPWDEADELGFVLLHDATDRTTPG